MLLLIDKPKGVTSHDVVDHIRDITGKKKVGHGGTLDPNATGLLVVGVTRGGTKQLGPLQTDTKKTYEATVCFGKQTDTLDADGEVIAKSDVDAIPMQQITSVLDSFLGTQQQKPPAYSAVRVNGERAYKQARSNKSPDVPPRVIEVYSLDIDSYSFPNLRITTTVSSGTYIRSLARDIGRRLGCVAFLQDLRRTRVGQFSIDDAHELTEITPDNWRDVILA